MNRCSISRLVSRGILVMQGTRVDVAASDAVLDDQSMWSRSRLPRRPRRRIRMVAKTHGLSPVRGAGPPSPLRAAEGTIARVRYYS